MGRQARKSRSRSRPSSRPRSPGGATSCSRPPPRPTTTSWPSTSTARRSRDPELDACLRKGVKESILAPVLVGSAVKGIGLRGLLDAFIRYLPSPADEAPVTAHEPKSSDPVPVAAGSGGPLLVRAFKTAADPFVGRLTYLRVFSGTLHGQDHAWNANRGEDERIGQLLLIHGKDQEPVGELKAGEIGAVAKLAVTETGDTLTSREKPLVLDRLMFPAPSLTVAIEPQTKADLDKMGAALTRMLEEEPTARRRAERRPASSSSSPWARPTSRSSASGSSASSGRRS